MADIKTSSLFNTSPKKNNAMNKIRDARAKEKHIIKNNIKKTKIDSTTSINVNQNESKIKKMEEKASNTKKVGAPIRLYDKAYKTTQSIKLSAILNSTVRLLSEKYMSDSSKDEILRRALNEMIVRELAPEDRQSILNDMEKELSIFREKYPTIIEKDINGNIIRDVQEIENDTLNDLKKVWKTK